MSDSFNLACDLAGERKTARRPIINNRLIAASGGLQGRELRRGNRADLHASLHARGRWKLDVLRPSIAGMKQQSMVI